MRILLIAYEFPPIPSPQALRWAYLTRELAALGHEVHVLAPDVAGYGPGGLPTLPESVVVHRCFPGPVMGLVASRAARRATGAHSVPEAVDSPAEPHAGAPVGLNWKGRLLARIKTLLGFVLFPDIRGEWTPWARPALRRVLAEIAPDVVISSHEPANTLGLGLLAQRLGYRWLADLGDPVLAPYTPKRWRRKSLALEARVCRLADHVLVTCESARTLLESRHGLAANRCTVLTQGFDDRLTDDDLTLPGCTIGLADDRLELLYAGSFYAFRKPDELLAAVLATPGVRLNVATALTPPGLLQAAREHPEQIRLLGFLGHRQSLAVQRRCHVLINIANRDSGQVPGKLYEYLGAGRPILHLGAEPDDAARLLLERSGAGTSCANQRDAIARCLCELRRNKPAPGPTTEPLRPEVAAHAWSALGRQLAGILVAVIAREEEDGAVAESTASPARSPAQRRSATATDATIR
ncbi:MAG: glycosyltransferase [Xanthomonadaceae bacterium]|nr:glycosyltransferase [Xanthomonadaceae bacterium]